MHDSFIIKGFIGLGFIFFGFNLMYIIIKKVKNKKNSRNNLNNLDDNFPKPRLFARLGLMIMNVFIILCFLNILFYDLFKIIIPRIDFLTTSLPVKIIGFGLVIIGNIMLFFAYRELGICWAYPLEGGKRTKRVVKTGIYGKIRHPIYLSFNIFSIGFNLILLDWLLLILYIFGGIGLYVLAIDEEKLLIAIFGDEYLDYKKKVGRFFPKISQ